VIDTDMTGFGAHGPNLNFNANGGLVVTYPLDLDLTVLHPDRDTFETTLDLSAHENVLVEHIRIEQGDAEMNDSFITLTWDGNGTATLYDPDNQFQSHANGAELTSGVVLEAQNDVNSGDASWYIIVRADNVTMSFIEDDHFILSSPGEAGKEEFVFTPSLISTGNTNTFVEGQGAVSIGGMSFELDDIDENDIVRVTMTADVSRVLDGNDEQVTIGGQTFSLATTQSVTALNVGGFLVDINYNAATGAFNITNNAGATVPMVQTDLDALLAGIVYNNVAGDPTDGVRTFSFVAEDAGGLISNTAVSTILVEPAPAVPPVVIDLDGDGVEFLSTEEGVMFDVDGDGVEEKTAWAGNDDALLVYDKDDDGNITDHDEISFTGYAEGAETDLEGLRAFDTDDDGLLDSDDEEWGRFKLWQDKDGDGKVDEGELISLDEAGIESVGLYSDLSSYSAADGDVHVHGESEVIWKDGRIGSAADSSFDYAEILDSDADDAPMEVITDSGEVIDLNSGGSADSNYTAVDQTDPAADFVAPETLPTAGIDEVTANEVAMS